MNAFRHVKSDALYHHLGEAPIQVSTPRLTSTSGYVLAHPGCPSEWRVKPDDLEGSKGVCILEEDDTLSVYQPNDRGRVFCRATEEFHDGRFEPMAIHHHRPSPETLASIIENASSLADAREKIIDLETKYLAATEVPPDQVTNLRNLYLAYASSSSTPHVYQVESDDDKLDITCDGSVVVSGAARSVVEIELIAQMLNLLPQIVTALTRHHKT